MTLNFGILFGIITMLSWGISDFFAAKASRKIGAIKTVIWSQIIGVAVFALIFIIFFNPIAISSRDIIIAIASGVLSIVGLASLYKGFELGNISIVSPIASSSAVVTVILSIFLLGEKISAVQETGVSLAIIGTVLVSFKIHDLIKLNLGNLASGVKYGFAAMFAFGVSYVLIDMLIHDLGWFVPVFLVKSFGLAFIIVFSADAKEEILFPKRAANFVFIVGVLETLAFLSLGAGISIDYTSIIIPIASAFPAVTIVLAGLFFREQMDANQKIGVAAVLCGLILLSV